ncbi:MAG TPA: hypothetical protein VLW54_01220, partial [Candidatus Acidoferrales bacterium]|nr:hypothetical protein [Candidatus Acidoferrales bacterium]
MRRPKPAGTFRPTRVSESEAFTENRLPEAATELSPELLATLVEIGEEVNSSLDLDQVLKKAAELVRRLVPYEIFAVLRL